MLRGTSKINLDAKGRIAIPTRYRPELKESCDGQMIVTLALDEKHTGLPGCLWLYPLHEWEKLEAFIDNLSSGNKANESVRRFIIGNANECEMDGQGRLLLPETLRSLVNLEKKIILSGQLKKFEIWNEEAWNQRQMEMLSGNPLDGDTSELKRIPF